MKTKESEAKPSKRINKFKKQRKKSRTKARRKRRLRAKQLKNKTGRPLAKTFHRPFFSTGLSNMSGQCFWLNYSNVFKWKDLHSSAGNFHPSFTFNLPVFSPSVPKERPDSWVSLGDQSEDSESDDDIVVTEEMMQFLEISVRHKASLKAEREEATKLGEKSTTLERNAIDDCQQPNEDDIAEKRRAEMSILYGKDAPMIHGMETAMQLTFDRQVDVFNPPYWPVHPFSIQFKESG